MSNNENQCKDLSVPSDSYPEWDAIFRLQKTIQEKTYGYNFERMTLQELGKFWLMNKHALEDELSEMMNALGGIHDGIGNAVWKPWKRDHVGGAMLSMKDMSEGDRQELQMEIVDAFHFLINFAVSTGFTGSDIANGYVSKNKENIERQERGY